MCTECTRVYVQQTLHVARCMRLEFYLQFTFGGNALYAHLNQNADFNDDVKVFVFFFFVFTLRQQGKRLEGPGCALACQTKEGNIVPLLIRQVQKSHQLE